ncbi:integrase [Limosilactobacillus reuteri]|uniref:Integrase n=1 Tax=Limosilactobacillus reuteri TaxID=1598 RepID=A0ABD6Y6K8_LIMRT|nr:site-specific integrase [Limosilactobacillus reuteri]PWT34580.1 integrase [Limosilactobacillus reuteri]PWT37482.1 integrase [Limosilactobacillus reuteri]PWT57650.1 integrase [Limosilactobacillus reuteri]PWT58448.1 integrase [Limosilactobacillus reuteri]PWT65336.1 integrase [Limosilactobacillus reuteri]
MERKENLKYQIKKDRIIRRYATKARMAKINPKNIKVYQKYLRSRTIQHADVKNTTYKVYQSYMNIFMCYIAEEWGNFYLLDEDILNEDMLDVMEAYMAFLADDCGNGKKVINTKVSAVSSFYQWAARRRLINNHPFAGKLERIKHAHEEKRIAVHFLHEDQIKKITETLAESKTTLNKYDRQDELIWNIAFDSACRIGALHQLSISNLNLNDRVFKDVREKESKIVDIPFTERTQKIIEEYLAWREQNGIETDAFFYNRSFERMSRQGLALRIRKIGEIIGIGDFRPHSIRKSRLNQIGQTGNIELAKELAHHESMDTTARFYMEKKSSAETLKEIDQLMQ